MTNKNHLNPQPFAAEKKDRQTDKDKPSNLAGTELEKNFKEKISKARKRNNS